MFTFYSLPESICNKTGGVNFWCFAKERWFYIVLYGWISAGGKRVYLAFAAEENSTHNKIRTLKSGSKQFQRDQQFY